jgi:hypothetical protein
MLKEEGRSQKPEVDGQMLSQQWFQQLITSGGTSALAREG